MTGLHDRHDEEALADAFDKIVDGVFDGQHVDTKSLLPDRPDLDGKITDALQLARLFGDEPTYVRPVIPGHVILRELGRGGMGTVYLARNIELDRTVAVKVLPRSCAISARARERFRHEAQALARIRHRQIIQVHEVIEDEDLLAYAMEWIDGASLSDVMTSLPVHNGQATVADLARVLGVDSLTPSSWIPFFVSVGAAIAAALHEVHESGLVHRDVKPANILLRRDGQPVLTDFGLVRAMDSDLTQTGVFVGTPEYAAPEQLAPQDGDVDRRTDVYALGVTLFEVIAGRVPFRGKTSSDVLRKIDAGDAPRLRKIAPHAPRDLETVLSKAMARDPEHRYATAEEFSLDLQAILDLRPTRARPEGVVRRAIRMLRRYRRVAWAATVGAAVVIGVVLALTYAAGARARANLEANALQARVWMDLLAYTRDRRSGTSATQHLNSSLDAYARARQLTPTDERIRVGAGLAGLARDVIDVTHFTADESRLHRLDLRDYPLTERAVAGLLKGRNLQSITSEVIRAAETSDREWCGLLALLVDNEAVCRACWQDLSPSDIDKPIVSATLGEMLLRERRPALAYPHLLAAHTALPNDRALKIDLATAALRLGRLDEAMQLVAQVETDFGPRCVILRAEIALELGDTQGAREAFESVLRNHPDHVDAQFGLARVDAASHDYAAAKRRLHNLVTRRRSEMKWHRALAEVARRDGDLITYLAQARLALTRSLPARGARLASDSVVRHCLAILEMGGFDRLASRVRELTGHRTPAADRELLTSGWTLGAAIPKREAIERILERSVAYDLDVFERYRYASSFLTGISRTCAAAAKVIVHFPESLVVLPASRRAIAHGLALALREVWNELSLHNLADCDLLLRPNHTTGLESLHTLRPPGHFRFFAADVAVIGDVNGDGKDDIAVASRIDERVFSGATGGLLRIIGADLPNALRGVSICGDVDRDGCADIFTANIGYDEGRGIARVYSGRSGAVLLQFLGDQRGDEFGAGIASIGDCDGDAAPDLVVMWWRDGRSHARFFSGVDGSRLFDLRFEKEESFQGARAAGDVDGDRRDDLLLMFRSHAAIYSGRTRTEMIRFPHPGEWTRASACVGDIDGDGTPDFAVGGGGALFLYSGRIRKGKKAELLDQYVCNDDEAYFGRSIHGLGDLTGDGRPEIAVSAPDYAGKGPGSVVILDVVNGRTLQTLYGFGPRDTFGKIMDTGDVDGDGTIDLVVSGEQPSKGRGWPGYVRVFASVR